LVIPPSAFFQATPGNWLAFPFFRVIAKQSSKNASSPRPITPKSKSVRLRVSSGKAEACGPPRPRGIWGITPCSIASFNSWAKSATPSISELIAVNPTTWGLNFRT